MSTTGATVERASLFPVSPVDRTASASGGLNLETNSPPERDTDDEAQGRTSELGGSLSYVIRIGLFMVAAITLGLTVNLVVGSRLEQRVAQTEAFNRFRSELALGTAPLGPRLSKHRVLPAGTPMALIQIPSLGVKEVVGEGTTSAVLMTGPGHLPSTPFPGGVGTSVIYGRAAAYGGPFGRIDQLHKGARITVTTQVGQSTFRVIDRRRAGDVIPTLGAGEARLTLVTATGPAFVPSGVVWVDADLVGTPLQAQKPVVDRVPASERPLGVDTGSLGFLAFWLGALVLVLTGAIWTWRRRGHAQAWITFTMPIAVVSYFVAGQLALLLPNVM